MKGQIALALALGAASLAGGVNQASAAATDLGSVSLTQINAQGGQLNETISYDNKANVADYYTFIVSASQTNWNLDFSFSAPSNFSKDGSFTIELRKINNAGNLGQVVYSSTSVANGDQLIGILTNNLGQSEFSLPYWKNGYAIEIINAGKTTGAGSGILTFSTAVPETSTWLMMFAGFGALGFVGFRRRKADRLTA
jgi:hypothetical protein